MVPGLRWPVYAITYGLLSLPSTLTEPVVLLKTLGPESLLYSSCVTDLVNQLHSRNTVNRNSSDYFCAGNKPGDFG